MAIVVVKRWSYREIEMSMNVYDHLPLHKKVVAVERWLWSLDKIE